MHPPFDAFVKDRRRVVGVPRVRAWTSRGREDSRSRPRASASRNDGEERAVGSARADLLELLVCQPRALKERVPALGLGGLGEWSGTRRAGSPSSRHRAVLGGESRGRRLSAPVLASTLASTSRARLRVAGADVAGLGVRVISGVDVEQIRLAASCGRDVEGFSGGAGRNECVGGPDGAALGAMGGRGVGKLDMFSDVVSRQNDDAVAAGPSDGHGPVVVGGSHDPAVAIFDPAGSGGEVAVVATGDDVVADADRLPCGDRQTVFGDFPAAMRSARARRFSSATVAVSGAIMRLELPVSMSCFHAR